MGSVGNEIGKSESRGLLFRHLLQKIFLEDWHLKLLALGITLALWLGVTGLSTPTTTRLTGVPLTLRFASNTEVTNSPIQEVDIIISGDKRRLDQINKNNLLISVDLSDVPPGERLVQLSPENVNLDLPTGVKLEEIQPNRIAVKIETVEETEVEVKVETEGELPDGYEFYVDPIALPSRVTVRGPSSFIRGLTVVSTEKIDISERKDDFVAKQISLNLANPKSSILDSVVDVSFRIGERRIERLFLLPVGGNPDRRATVVLFGPRTPLIQTEPSEIEVVIDINAGGEEIPRLVLPQRLQGRVLERQLKIN